MINRLRKRFIRIAMAAVASVMLALCLIVNAANFLSTDAALSEMLQSIRDNQGKVPFPGPGEHPGMPGGGQFTPETPYSTRFFVLRYTSGGTLIKADLDNIAAVTEDNVGEYLTLALSHGDGFGYADGYKFYIASDGDDRQMAIFLDGYKELHSVLTTALLSLAAAAFCIAVVYCIVVLSSRRAIDPVVRSYERQKQFITDAGHELKTPITVIATCLKVLEMETGGGKWIDKARAQTEKLTSLVNSLVTLSRMDEEQSPLKMEPFPISDALRESALSFTEYAEERGHALELSIEEGLTYTGDEYAVRQLASILLDNAVKYALPGSAVSFSLEKTRRGVTISTSNACEELPPETLSRLFDRFYRADPSRSADGGFGIGLSIARSIAEGHHGCISARMEHGRIRFTAELK